MPNDKSPLVNPKKKSSGDKEMESTLVFDDSDMEICDPCYCYSKCWLDTVASLFCVSLL